MDIFKFIPVDMKYGQLVKSFNSDLNLCYSFQQIKIVSPLNFFYLVNTNYKDINCPLKNTKYYLKDNDGKLLYYVIPDSTLFFIGYPNFVIDQEEWTGNKKTIFEFINFENNIYNFIMYNIDQSGQSPIINLELSIYRYKEDSFLNLGFACDFPYCNTGSYFDTSTSKCLTCNSCGKPNIYCLSSCPNNETCTWLGESNGYGCVKNVLTEEEPQQKNNPIITYLWIILFLSIFLLIILFLLVFINNDTKNSNSKEINSLYNI